MVYLSKIYTKTGDQGTTCLGDGQRVEKNNLYIKAIGSIDEVNALIGIIVCYISPETKNLLHAIQNDLFDIGADLCVPFASKKNNRAKRIDQTYLSFLETSIDQINKNLSPLTSFILPGGCLAASYLHLARTVTRRAERDLFSLSQTHSFNPFIFPYINRLSDLFFVLSRHENQKGEKDILWKPGKNQPE